MSHVIMSLKPEYGELVLSGSKTVELRNRVVRIEPDTTIWIYFTSPVSKIVGVADVSSVICDSPPVIWRRFRKGMCIDRLRFDEYVGDRIRVSALVLKNVKKLDEPVPIGGIRRVVRSFHPPQFYSRVTPESRLFRLLNGDSGTASGSSDYSATVAGGAKSGGNPAVVESASNRRSDD